jgi:LmbE family N-acetylglucosaminyl deacetylase
MAGVALALLAHPDDAEFLCAGTLALMAQKHQWQVHIASMTPGDCGSMDLAPDEISRIRRNEGAQAASLIGATYHCLEERDLLVFYQERALEKVVRLLRQVQPDVVFTHSPADYLLDHEMTSTVARAASFGAPTPNLFRERGHERPLAHVPHLYYCDPIEGKDALGRAVPPGFCIDISQVIETKTQMLATHASQREWLLKHHGMDQYLMAMRSWSSERGRAVGVDFAEGFRQHLGHSYPQDNLVGELLGALKCLSSASEAG